MNRTQRRCHDEKRAVLFRMVVAATKLPRLPRAARPNAFQTSAFLRIHDPAECFRRFITGGKNLNSIFESFFTRQMAAAARSCRFSSALTTVSKHPPQIRISSSRARFRRQPKLEFLINVIYKKEKKKKKDRERKI